MKRFLAFFLVICMCLPMNAMQVSATEATPDENYAEEHDLANSWRYKDGERIEETILPAEAIISEDGDVIVDEEMVTAYHSGATLTGIDVSEHQGYIDWAKVKAAGIDFAIIRCGFGQNKTSQDDDYFLQNAQGCEAVGMPYGVYLYSYAKNTSAASSEADHVLRLLKGRTLSYPVFYDMEESSQASLGKTALANLAKTFCNKIQAAGYPVGVYANLNWWSNYLTDSCFNNWYKWYAQYSSTPTWKDGYTIWQYSSSGKVNGVSGNVDMNYQIGYPEDHGKISSTPTETYLTVTKDTYSYGEAVQVTASHPNSDAWVAIYGEGDTGVESYYWYYVNRYYNQDGYEFTGKSGETYNIFDTIPNGRAQSLSGFPYGLPAGSYEIYLYGDGGYSNIVAKKKISISNTIEPSITLSKGIYAPGETVEVTTISPHYDGWVGIYAGTPSSFSGDSPSIDWEWTIGKGGLPIALANEESTKLSAGTYTAVLFADEDYTVLKKVTFAVSNEKLITNKTTYNMGEEIIVSTNYSGTASWVGLYKEGETPGNIVSLYWYYLDGVGSSRNILGAGAEAQREGEFTPGKYKVVLFGDSGYNNIIAQKSITVACSSHSYNTEVSRTASTCTTQGSVTKKCACGATTTEKLALDSNAHSWNTTPSSYKKNGSTCVATYTCKNNSGHTKTENQSHSAKAAVKENVVAATCGKGGSYDEVVYCSKCNGEMSRTAKTTSATGNHNYTTEVSRTNSTCTTQGTETKKCSCGATNTTKLAIDANAHTWNTTPSSYKKDGEHCVATYTCKNDAAHTKTENKSHAPKAAVKENAVPATCGKDGSYDSVVYCSQCNGEISRTNTKDPATGKHTADTPISENEVPASCDKDGSYDEVVKCKTCGYEMSRTQKSIPSTGDHNYATEVEGTKIPATCKQTGSVTKKCGCGATQVQTLEIDPNAHTAKNPVRENEQPTTCGAPGSYDEVVYCKDCNHPMSRTEKPIPATGNHNYTTEVEGTKTPSTCSEEGSVTKKCACGATEVCPIEIDKDAHDWNETPSSYNKQGSNCIAVYKCKHNASHVISKVGEHKAETPVKENEVPATCKVPGSYDSVTKCSNCKKEIRRVQMTIPTTEDHVPNPAVKENVVPETCGDKGTYENVIYCNVCEKEISRRTVDVPATGSHSWDNGTITAEATPEKDGVKTFTCTVCDDTKTEPVKYVAPETPEEPTVDGVQRIFGSNRFKTSLAIADQIKTLNGVDAFDTVIIASGMNFADALAGSYLAYVKNAPILMMGPNNASEVQAYILQNVKAGGTVYVLGGTAAVPDSSVNVVAAAGYNVKRLAGSNRYATNLEILKEANVTNQPILVCTGTGFADSLSASAAKMPILLVGKSLNADQKAYLSTLSTSQFYVIGGESAVSASVMNEVKAFGKPVERVGGKNRYETSVMIAEKFVPNSSSAVIAYARTFPDGLCGGPLAAAMGAPLILTATGQETIAANYANSRGIKAGYVLGGAGLISDSAAKNVFGMEPMNK